MRVWPTFVVGLLLAVVAAQPHAIHGSANDDIVNADNLPNEVLYPEWRKLLGDFKSVSYREHLAALFAVRDPHVHKVLIGANVPDLDAAGVFEGTPVDGVDLYDQEDTKSVPFPLDRLVPSLIRDDQHASLYETTAAQLGTPIKAQYLLVDHTISEYTSDPAGNEYSIGVIPSKAVGGMVPNLCLLYVAAPGEHDRARVPYLNNGVPIVVVFTWPIGTSYVYSNICFEENWFWSGGDLDINVHDGNSQKPTKAPKHAHAKVDTLSRWPPTFALYGGLQKFTEGRN
eukprot:gnl/Spiro4/11538_TR6096_c0_g1_i1.p2 gnl/Spiro4/11538_TR6096_c0_g1~~gnl/Spiro4/11538_TR6096_c0_g1_i1.p2  ORF type:complete len:295 (-),score=79.66 gnl/Spiro4/11538_TR6096_c0_g1_i1:70-924(-)